ALVNCGTIDINFAFSVETIIVLPLGELLVQHNVNIIGPTTYPLSIDGNGQYRAFHIDPGKIVSISNLTITDCVTSGDGGGILNNGALTLKGVTVNGNTAVNGGGIASPTNNSLTLINTTISGNKSSGNGGGLYNDTGIATLTNVTIAYNTADSDGVGSESGGGIFVTSGDVTLHNTIVTDNLKGKDPITAADDVGGVNLNAASSYNLIGIISSGGLNVGNNNQLGVASALLKPLQDNGGPTRTHALTYKSPAVDQGDGCVVSGCSLSSPVVDIDQRGKPRTPLNDGDDNGATGVDIGAYERQVTETRDVPTGDPSTVDVVDAIITFLCVEPCGGSRVNPGSTKSASAIAPSLASPTASLAAIDPAPLNSLQRPNNTVIGAGSSPPLPAFEVSTTATYTPPATVCFYLPSITDLTFFNTLKVLHREAGPNLTYGDSDDTLFEPPGGTTRFFASKLLCVQVQSFSAFAIAQTVSVGPTAEDATVSGQILDNQGNPVEGAALRMSGTQNRLTITDAEGKYHFEDVETNGFYVITPSRANFTFSPAQRSFSQLGANTEATFTGSASGGGLNPLDVTEYFVRQQYLDFLGREPDNSGFNFWVNNIESCGNDIGCREVKRIDTSAAFFLSIESRQTGYLIYRFYQAAYGEIPNTPVPLRLSEYTSDATRISKGVVVLQNGWQRTLENNTRAFAEDFVKRDRFVAAYPVTMTPVEFVDKLFVNGQIPVTDGDHAAAIAEFGGAPDTSEAAARARALRRIAENSVLERRHFNRAFVLMQYFGYLRRDPNSGQDRDFSGFNFWLDKLDRFDGNFREAEMVRAFLTSIEYRARISR
ncbi:MAG TPA: choice-of-anchor Q domain-containing protein, partial [Pyrinomonadaceae bacterium]|nr:choice-of-anchor Q domain-containing protein [Pyrinomonadaceae bacterium]